MLFHFNFLDRDGRERFRTDDRFAEPIDALLEAERIAERVVLDPVYLTDYGAAHLRIENENRTISMRFSVKALLDLADRRSASARARPPARGAATVWPPSAKDGVQRSMGSGSRRAPTTSPGKRPRRRTEPSSTRKSWRHGDGGFDRA